MSSTPPAVPPPRPTAPSAMIGGEIIARVLRSASLIGVDLPGSGKLIDVGGDAVQGLYGRVASRCCSSMCRNW